MIYTITLNPALDRILTVESIDYYNPNRVDGDDRYAGGKGIDVSKALTRLAVNNKAIGFAGGFTGAELEGLDYRSAQIERDLPVSCRLVNIHVGAGFCRDSNELAVDAEIKQASFELCAGEPASKSYRFVLNAESGECFGYVDTFAPGKSLIAVDSVRVVIIDRLDRENTVKGRIQRDRIYHAF